MFNDPTNRIDPTGETVYRPGMVPMLRHAPPPRIAAYKPPAKPKGFLESVGNSLYSMALCVEGMVQEQMGDGTAVRTYEEAYQRGVLGQTKDSSGGDHYGTRGVARRRLLESATTLAVGIELAVASRQEEGLTLAEWRRKPLRPFCAWTRT